MNQVVYIAGAVVLGAALGYYAAPAKIETKIVIQKDTQRQNDINTKITRTRKPDGTVVTKVEKEDKSTTHIEEHKDATKIVERPHNTLFLRGMFSGDIRSGTMNYGLGIDKQVLGPVYIGVFGFSDGRIGEVLRSAFHTPPLGGREAYGNVCVTY
jgi:hypothetical protein